MAKIKKIRKIKSKIKILENSKPKEESKLEKEIEKKSVEEFIETLKERKINIAPILERSLAATEEVRTPELREENKEQKNRGDYSTRRATYAESGSQNTATENRAYNASYSMSPETAFISKGPRETTFNRVGADERKIEAKRDMTGFAGQTEMRGGEYAGQINKNYGEQEAQERREKRRRF